MRHHPARRLAGLAGAIAAACAAGCALAPPASPPASAPAAAPAVAAAPAAPAADSGTLVLATMKTDHATEQGASIDGFAYSEKPGDASFGKVSVAQGVARVTGLIWPQKGSTWGGIGFTVGAARGGKPMDLSAYKTLTIELAASTPGTLRLRVVGADKATRDNGCYPIQMQAVTPQLQAYRIDLGKFAPESYCGGNARGIAATSAAVTAFEVADARVAGGKRDVDFQVGRISLSR